MNSGVRVWVVGLAWAVFSSLGCSSDTGQELEDTDNGLPSAMKPDVYVQHDLRDGASTATTVRLLFEEVDLDEPTVAVTELVFVPGADEFLILEKDGRVVHFELTGEGARSLGSFQVPGVFAESDCGLIGAAFDPDFASNGFLYFGYCVAQQYNRITRHQFDTSDYGLIESSATEIVSVGDPLAPKSWHNVGSIGFDDHGNLWALFGEKRLEDEAQDVTNNLGTLIRVVPNKEPDGEGHMPAPDNPFVGDGEKSEDIYAYGLRSPWKGSLDSRGRWWIGDVGAASTEEVNIITDPGQNFGWPEWEGPCGANCEGLRNPLTHWDRSSESDYALEDPETNATDRRVVWVGPEYRARSGIDRYEGRLTNKVLFGDFCAGWVRAAELDAQDRLIYDAHAGHLDAVTGIAEGADGYVYFVTYGNCKTFPYREGRMWRAVLAD